MDIEEIAKHFDASMRAAIEEVREDLHSENINADRINHHVAKTSKEWAAVFECPKTKAYTKLGDLVIRGKWKKISAKSKTMSGRATHYYYPAGMNPFLDEEE